MSISGTNEATQSVPFGTPVATGGANAAGSAATAARSDHVHLGAGALSGGYAQVTANQTAIVAEVDLTSLTVTVTTLAGRRYRITAHADFINDTINGAAGLFLQQDGVQIQRFFTPPSPVANQPMGAHLVAVVTPSAASHTYKLRAARSNAGTVTLEAGATFPAFILVEDIGV